MGTRGRYWDCKGRGCFVDEKCPRLGNLDELFPGNNGLSDIDGWLHLYGYHLFIEWKTGEQAPTGGQRKGLESLSENHTVIVAFGDAKKTIADAAWLFQSGKLQKIVRGHDAFLKLIREWVELAKSAAEWLKSYDARCKELYGDKG